MGEGMIITIRPHGAIAKRLVKSIAQINDKRFAVIDNSGNWYGVEDLVYYELKFEGYPEVQRIRL